MPQSKFTRFPCAEGICHEPYTFKIRTEASKRNSKSAQGRGAGCAASRERSQERLYCRRFAISSLTKESSAAGRAAGCAADCARAMSSSRQLQKVRSRRNRGKKIQRSGGGCSSRSAAASLPEKALRSCLPHSRRPACAPIAATARTGLENFETDAITVQRG